MQPGALYYHVASKQDLLAAVAEQILDRADDLHRRSRPGRARHPRRAAADPRQRRRDLIRQRLPPRGARPIPDARAERSALPTQQARWAARTLIHYVLGFVAEEQNQAELVRARIVTDLPEPQASTEAFQFGVATILRGLPDSGR